MLTKGSHQINNALKILVVEYNQPPNILNVQDPDLVAIRWNDTNNGTANLFLEGKPDVMVAPQVAHIREDKLGFQKS